jgi:hypothetical protein
MTQKTNQNPWTMDVRVRERNLKSGALTDKDVDKHLAALPDVADQAEPFGIAQPALTDQPQHVPAPVAHVAAIAAPSSIESDDDMGDEEEDEQDDEVDNDGDGDSDAGGDAGGGAGGDAGDGGGDVTNGGGEPT